MVLPRNLDAFGGTGGVESAASATSVGGESWVPGHEAGYLITNSPRGSLAAREVRATGLEGHTPARMMVDGTLGGREIRTVGASSALPTAIDPIDFVPSKVDTQIRLDFGAALRSLPDTTSTGNYVVSGPSAVSVTSVVFTPGNTFVLLNHTGNIIAGVYTITLAPLTAQALNNDAINTTVGQSFVLAGVLAANFNSGFN